MGALRIMNGIDRHSHALGPAAAGAPRKADDIYIYIYICRHLGVCVHGGPRGPAGPQTAPWSQAPPKHLSRTRFTPPDIKSEPRVVVGSERVNDV